MPKVPKISLYIFAVTSCFFQKSMRYEIDFLPVKKPKMFYKLIVSLWVYLARHAQSTQNNKFSISLQYLKENVKDKVDFCLLIIVKGFLKVIVLF